MSEMTDREKLTAFTTFSGCAAQFAIAPLLPILKAWVSVKLWGWFVVPQFGVAPLSLLNAYGLSLIVSFWTLTIPREDAKANGTIYQLTMTTALYLTALFFGWAAHAMFGGAA